MIKVLIVDDIKENLYMLESLLKGNGFLTVTANNGSEALVLALNEPPDLIISDILMPVMDGYSLCREWEKNNVLCKIPFVFYTATYTHPKDEHFALSLGADMFILKPQDPVVFIEKIKKVLIDFNIHESKMHKPIELSEVTVLKEYNETLIRKLEDRMLKSEESERKLRIYATQLEQEIEQRKQITNAFEESEEKFRIITDNSADAIFITDKQQNFLYVNAQAIGLLGYSKNEMLARSISDIAPRMEVDKHLQLFQKLLDDGKLSTEIQMLKKDGSIVPVDINAIILQNGMVYGSCRDITTRKLSEEELKKSEQRFRTLAESAPVGIFTTDSIGITNYVNPRWCEITQLSQKEAQGLGWLKSVHPNDQESLDKLWQQAILRGASSDAEYRFLHQDGSIAWVLGHAIPQKDESGATIGYIGTITDITERKFMEEEIQKLNDTLEQNVEERTAQLVAANKDLEAFSYSVSHDLRAPLRHISGFIQLFLDQRTTQLTDKELNRLNTVAEAAHKMGELIDGLLVFSRLNRNEIVKKPVETLQMIDQAMRFFVLEMQKRNIDIKIGKLHQTYGDSQLLQQVWVNLISNAIKYTGMKDKALIEIGSYFENNHTVFFIKDNGAGFDMQYYDKLFGVFQRLHSPNEFEGIGIGLANVNRIITRHGGRCWAEGEIDKGATFYFSLPNI